MRSASSQRESLSTMKRITCLALFGCTLVSSVFCQGSATTFWNDYPPCEESCHQTVYSNQKCTLPNQCSGCNGCLCIIDTCLCATVSWLTAVAQCIGQQCGSAAVYNASSISNAGCNSHDVVMALNTSAFIQAGLAAIPTTATATSSSTSTASATANGEPSNTQDSNSLSIPATIGLTVGCAVGAALVTLIGTWYRPNQIGRFITCGKWPRKHESRKEARQDMRYLVPFAHRPSRKSGIHGHHSRYELNGSLPSVT